MIAAVVALLVVGCGADEGSERPAQDQAGFPVTVEHKFGSTTVEQAPERVVAVGVNDQDFALSPGVTPVGVRQFQGGIDITKRPWAQDELGGAEPEIIGAEEIDRLAGESFYAQLGEEQLRLLDQDVLVAYGTRKDFERSPLFRRLDAVREGRVIYLDVDGDFADALGFSGPLSLPFALDWAVPRLAAAVEPAK